MRVAVALSTYAGAAFLPAQLASLRRQQRLPDLLVVRDDGSTDGTLDLLEALQHEAPFEVRLLPGGDRLGSTASFERVLAAARDEADVVLLCDQDDVWWSDKVARLVAALAASPAASLAFSDARLVDEAGEPLGYTAWESVGLDAARREQLAGEGALDLLLGVSLVTGMCTAVRSSLLRRALPLPAAVRAATAPDLLHDRWLSLVAAASGPLVTVPEPLADYRRHGEQQLGLAGPAAAGPAGRPGVLARLERLRDPDLGETVRRELQGDAVRSAVLLEHLAARGVGDGAGDAVVPRVRRRVAHLEAVLALPSAGVRRGAGVAREVARGGYRSGGGAGVLDDVLRRAGSVGG